MFVLQDLIGSLSFYSWLRLALQGKKRQLLWEKVDCGVLFLFSYLEPFKDFKNIKKVVRLTFGLFNNIKKKQFFSLLFI